MGYYVDGFVVPVQKKKLAAYRALAKKAGKLWIRYGALSYVECLPDDVPLGKVTSFPRSVKLTKDEVVVFSWITYKSRKDRDAVNAKVMKDPMMKNFDPKSMPFDMKRMIIGGFVPFLTLEK